MKKFFSRALLFAAALLMAVPVIKAQEAQPTEEEMAGMIMPLPVDSEVRIGVLPNGLTYYIRHNEMPKGQADFYIAQKVGSILEEENQRGLAHFLEHMCFNGTENFPGTQLRDWLESIGVKFGANLNAYTSVDQTVYNISNVPVQRKSVQDSCLLILHDWANALTLDPEEIDKERGVIQSEWLRGQSGSMRIIENLLPVIYPNNRYGLRLPIGTIDVITNFKPQELRDYYETWYRPDQQGIIVVGDIDVDYIEGKIKEMFSDIEMPADAKERVYFPVEDTEGTIYAIGSDPEMKYPSVSMMFKVDPIMPKEYKNSVQYLMLKYMVDMAAGMLDQRLTDMGQSADAPFAQAGFDHDNFFLAKTKDAFDLTGVAKGDNILPTLETMYRELLRAVRGGFTVGEYDRASKEYLSRIERAYNTRESRESEGYVNEYVNHFLDNEPIPSIEDEYEIMQMIVQNIDVNAINSVLPGLIGEDNRVIMIMAPQNETIHVPSEAEIAEVIAKVDAEDIEPYKDVMKEEPLIEKLPNPGKVVSVADDAQWGAKVLTLSNGVKVMVKPTDLKKDEILFNAIAIGGTSDISDKNAANLIYMPYAMSSHGLGTYTSIDLMKYLQGKQVGVDLSLSDYSRELEGFSTVKDLPQLFELIYMTFKDYTLDPDEFAANQSRLSNILANQETDPQYVFQKDMLESWYKSPAKRMLSSEIVNAADRKGILDIIHKATSNAADYTFIFVGDINMETFVPLVEQYIATLPAKAKKATKKYKFNLDREVTPGKAVDTFTAKMENPQTWCAVEIEGTMPYTVKNRVMSSMVGQILSNRLLAKIREEMGAVYSIGAYCQMSRTGKYNVDITIPFPMKPEFKDEVLKEIQGMVKAMCDDVTDDELAPAKEYMVKTYTAALDKNESWLGAMSATLLNGVDIFNGQDAVINSITPADIKTFMKELTRQDNYRVVILDPEK